MSALDVLNAGSLSLLQDTGRFGYAHLGLSNGGPLDPVAAAIANALLDNDSKATLIESTFGGLALRASGPAQIAVTGAPVSVQIDDDEMPMWTVLDVHKGQDVRLGFSRRGCRTYMAVRGGFCIAPCFGSTSTVVRESLGGLNGGALQIGDRLPIAASSPAPRRQLNAKQRPHYANSITLRVIPGYQYAVFSETERDRFFRSAYAVSPTSDRMGYRLTGDSVRWDAPPLLSEGIAPGAVQIPPDGQPIVLLNDRQTIGGYPKIGVVLSVDCGLLGQLRPGDTVHFAEIDLATAKRALNFAVGLQKTLSFEAAIA